MLHVTSFQRIFLSVQYVALAPSGGHLNKTAPRPKGLWWTGRYSIDTYRPLWYPRTAFTPFHTVAVCLNERVLCHRLCNAVKHVQDIF